MSENKRPMKPEVVTKLNEIEWLVDVVTEAECWRSAKVRSMKADALEEAAAEMDRLERISGWPEGSCTAEENAEVEAYDNSPDQQAWLRARATELRKP